MSVLSYSGSLVELPGGIAEAFDERIGLARDAEKRTVVLSADPAFAVNLDGWTAVHMLHVKSDTKITVRITSADGAQQLIPCDPMVTIVSRSVAITAIDLVRVAGQSATVEIILGQKN